MINPIVVKKWLARPLQNSDKVKSLSRRELKSIIRGLRPVPRFKTRLRTYQLATFLLCIKYPGYLISFDMGLGKTLTSLSAVHWRMDAKQFERALVLVPTSSNIGDWEDEVKQHFPELSFFGFHGNIKRKKRLRAADGTAQVLCMTYAGLQSLCCSVKTDARSERRKRKVDKKKAKRFFSQFGAIICDESTFVANPQSMNFKLMRAASRHVPRRYLLTGTPFGSDPATLWGQMLLVDGGETLGPTLGLYRAAFCSKVDTGWGFEYPFKLPMAKVLRRMLKHRSIRYEASEVLQDLPPLQKVVRKVWADEETYAYYHRIVEDLIDAKGNFSLVENSYHRMRQIASGWLSYLDPTGAKQTIIFGASPKMEALITDLKAMPDGSKGLIFNEYTQSGDLLEARLRKEGIAFVRVWGQSPRKRERLKKFKTDPKVRVLLIQNAAGSFGLNLQVANYVFVYESPVDPLRRQQMEKRAHRGGQTKTVFLYDYVTRKTIEIKIMRALERGRNLFKEILDGRASLV